MKQAITGFLVLMLAGYATAQIQPRGSVNDYLDAYIGTNAKPYLQPLANLVSSDINTGIWDFSSIPNKPYISLKVEGMMAIPKNSMRTFTGMTTGDFEPQQSATAPTVIGDQQPVILIGDNNTYYYFPGGYDLEQITLGTPQLTIGGIFHTEVSGRFLMFPLKNDPGDAKYFGIGGRHNLTGYFQNPPFDLTVGYFYHRIQVGSYINSDQNLWSVMLGKSGKMVSGHLSVGYQTSTYDIEYEYNADGDPYHVNLQMENKNHWILETGLGLRLGPITVSLAGSYARHVSIAAGAGLIF